MFGGSIENLTCGYIDIQTMCHICACVNNTKRVPAICPIGSNCFYLFTSRKSNSGKVNWHSGFTFYFLPIVFVFYITISSLNFHSLFYFQKIFFHIVFTIIIWCDVDSPEFHLESI